MQKSPFAVAAAVVGVGSLLLIGGCGGTSATGARATIANIQPTTYTEIAPATTTTSTTTLVPPVLEEGTRSPNEQSYTIQAGDSLSNIANRFDITLEQLVNYNQFAGGINELILPGDTIKIPPDALVPGTGSAGGDTGGDTGGDAGGDTGGDTGGDAGGDGGTDGEGCVHTIVAGENPNRVANKYEITVDELRAANPGSVMERFLVGDQLQIPANGDCS